MNSTASEEDESVLNMHENVYLTAPTTNGDQAGQIKQGAADSS